MTATPVTRLLTYRMAEEAFERSDAHIDSNCDHDRCTSQEGELEPSDTKHRFATNIELSNHLWLTQQEKVPQ